MSMKRKTEMKKEYRFILTLAAMILFSAFLPLLQANAQSNCDSTPPTVTILTPTTTAYTTDKAVVDLTGEVFEDFAVKEILWFNGGSASGFASASINGSDPLAWSAKSVPLAPGINVITVTAVDGAGNEGTDTIVVNYVAPTTSLVRELLNNKSKFTFYFNDPAYINIDRFSVVGYLKNKTGDKVILPFGKDVTITVTAPNPNDPTSELELFKTTIPSDSEFVTGTTRYLYRNSGSGIYEFRIERSTATASYMYIFVDRIEMLPAFKSVMTPLQYQAFVRSIKSYTMTIEFGDYSYTGTATLSPGTPSSVKQELVFNR
jgi:hypothetical protein